MISLNATSQPKPRKPGQRPEPETVKKTERDLDEFRKQNITARVYSDDGKELNPYVPHYIASVPWFYKTSEPTLRHQSDPFKSKQALSDIHEGYIRGVPVGEIPVKFLPGSCENCGSTTHKKKDCLERPRKLGAKFTNKNLKPADYSQPVLKLDFEGKRDRWAGYDPNEFSQVVQEYEIIEKTKQELKSKKLEEDILKGTSSSTSLKATGLCNKEDSDDDEKYAECSNMPGTKYDIKQRATVRNLRIREDTAKYLYNLDENSAFYDPKSRSMRGNPFKDTLKGQNVNFKGDQADGLGGEVSEVIEATKFTLNAFEKGIDVHLHGDPTKAELLMRQFKARREILHTDQQKDLLSRYGGEEHLFAPPKEILFDQTENYVEYSRTGKIIKGQERAPFRSKYIEDVFTNNHTTVWGSYWHQFSWGYACCHSLIKNSYCIGLQSEIKPCVNNMPAQASIPLLETELQLNNNIQSLDENESQYHLKRKYNVFHDVSLPTEQEMNKYYSEKKREGDPMSLI